MAKNSQRWLLAAITALNIAGIDRAAGPAARESGRGARPPSTGGGQERARPGNPYGNGPAECGGIAGPGAAGLGCRWGRFPPWEPPAPGAGVPWAGEAGLGEPRERVSPPPRTRTGSERLPAASPSGINIYGRLKIAVALCFPSRAESAGCGEAAKLDVTAQRELLAQAGAAIKIEPAVHAWFSCKAGPAPAGSPASARRHPRTLPCWQGHAGKARQALGPPGWWPQSPLVALQLLKPRLDAPRCPRLSRSSSRGALALGSSCGPASGTVPASGTQAAPAVAAGGVSVPAPCPAGTQPPAESRLRPGEATRAPAGSGRRAQPGSPAGTLAQGPPPPGSTRGILNLLRAKQRSEATQAKTQTPQTGFAEWPGRAGSGRARLGAASDAGRAGGVNGEHRRCRGAGGSAQPRTPAQLRAGTLQHKAALALGDGVAPFAAPGWKSWRRRARTKPCTDGCTRRGAVAAPRY